MHRLLPIALILSLPTIGRADTKVPAEVRAAYTAKAVPVRLTVVGWGDKAGARLQVGKARAVDLHEGQVAGALATGHGRVVVALAVDAADDPFQVVVIDGDKVGKPTTIARPTGGPDVPFAVAATETPDGFTVFFQEVPKSDPSSAHTYMVDLDKAGAPVGDAREIEVPWFLAAAAWNGTGYHLGLFYTESSGIRLSMVSLAKSGQPEQHPDWASAAGFIADVHLVAADGKVRAFYRGGKNGDRLLESDVTTIGNWGNEPAKAKDRGALPWKTAIAIDADGKPTKLRGGR